MTVTIVPNDTNIVYSPGNWDITSGHAKTINPGAYLRFLTTGAAAVTLNLDLTGNLQQSTYPRIAYRIDDGPWTKVLIAATITLALPTTSTWDHHVVEVAFVAAQAGFTNRFDGATSHVTITSITLDAGATLPVQTSPLRVLFMGDSIVEGRLTLKAFNADGLFSDVQQNWSWLLREELGAEVGIVAFGATGYWTVASGGNATPGFVDTHNLLWTGGPARDFTGYDAVIVALGTNDPKVGQAGEENTIPAITASWNSILSQVDDDTKLIAVMPLNGDNGTRIPTGLAATDDPDRIHYIDTTGWWTGAESSDGLHPWGYWHRMKGRQRLGAAVRDILFAEATDPTRYVSSGGVWVPA